ncbi:hypothetical protein [Arsenicicoccus piscis]|nr:hypothetical protein [Arsenicicoccus piscis]
MTALQPADSAHALSLMRLRRAAEELIERQADVEFLTLVGELQFDVELWAHIWAPTPPSPRTASATPTTSRSCATP